jgi:hypothetical protein
MIAIGLGTVAFVLMRTLGDSVQDKVAGDLELIGEATVLEATWDDREALNIWGNTSTETVKD